MTEETRRPTCPPVKWVVSLMVLPCAGIMGCSCLRVEDAVGISTCTCRCCAREPLHFITLEVCSLMCRSAQASECASAFTLTRNGQQQHLCGQHLETDLQQHALHAAACRNGKKGNLCPFDRLMVLGAARLRHQLALLRASRLIREQDLTSVGVPLGGGPQEAALKA